MDAVARLSLHAPAGNRYHRPREKLLAVGRKCMTILQGEHLELEETLVMVQAK
jgi:hypothetical protein